MKTIMLLVSVAVLASMLIMPGSFPSAQSPTATATRTATFTNEQLIAIGTIAPPPQCGNGYVPCGPLPYSVPSFPTLNLPSPTVVDLSGFVPTLTGPTNTPGGPTSTFQATLDRPALGTLGFGMYMMIQTISVQGTQYMVNGTPVGLATLADQIGSAGGALFAYAKAYNDNYPNMSATFGFLVVIIAAMVTVIVGTGVFQIAKSIARLVMQVIETVTP